MYVQKIAADALLTLNNICGCTSIYVFVMYWIFIENTTRPVSARAIRSRKDERIRHAAAPNILHNIITYESYNIIISRVQTCILEFYSFMLFRITRRYYSIHAVHNGYTRIYYILIYIHV